MPRDVSFAPIRKRSISDSNLNRFAPNFVSNNSTNIQDVLDCKSKHDYPCIEEQDEYSNYAHDHVIATATTATTHSKSPHQARRRKNGFVAISNQVCNTLSKFVGARKSLKRRSGQESDFRQLIMAIRNEDVNRVRFILDTCNVEVNGSDKKGVTALHEAAIVGYSDVIHLLLRFEAEVNKKDGGGFSCLDYAVLAGNFECAQFLIANGARTDSIRNGMPTFFPPDNEEDIPGAVIND